ncbi:MAG TPA: GH3 auxin-responsive promoter family protein, partial [Polyangiaceae bacterium]|nr:GH3 auxin-responsive promoter family protein [Polyangiaceae bacterium]
DCVSDLAGEKLDARVVGKALEAALSQTPGPWVFAMIAPKSGPGIGYRLYVESPRDDASEGLLAEQVERELCAGAHYAYCRKLGQLEAVEAVRVFDGAGAIERRRAAEGGKVGDVKPSPLDRRMGWERWFTTARGEGRGEG